MPFFAGASGQVFYRRWRCAGSVDRPAVVVLLHGLGQHSGDYGRFARLLTGRGMEVWALDHVGHGMTEGEPGRIGSMDGLVENARRLTDLAGRGGGRRPVLVGHSLGAVVATDQAMRIPEPCAGLVLSGVPFAPPVPGRSPRPGDDAPDVVERRAEIDDVRRRFVRDARVPALVLHGADDRIVPAEGVVRALHGRGGDTRIVVYDGAGHDLPHEHVRVAVADAIAEFTAGLGGAR
ncbi:alpha/beta hydrolase [Tomitella fengzijianii]|uniref:Lysophospholipase n=1 Tax=Tomitella fengzijianii TaxID=2597660 RepID=A0A516X3N9_9ACTN|nr:alpha/beta fold hydrolase [Tomitella fengzijianii]QDQ97261.1 lysophospholipase [Tomitella fengzijianii]